MSQPPPPELPPSVDYATAPRRSSPFRQAARFVGGALTGFAVIFLPTFLAGAEGFEGDVPRWAWPAVGVAAVLTIALAWRLRRNGHGPASAGVLAGGGVGLLLAGMCFSGM